MKRFWLVLLSLGLIVAFSTSAMAVDVKFNGEYYAAGLYMDRTNLAKGNGPSTAFYYQRLRLGTQFVVSPGLTLTTRADIMERAWGAARSNTNTALDVLSAGSRNENENIAFDLVYVNYVSPVGLFQAGYVIDGAWGTVFGDNSAPSGRIMYLLAKGPIQAAIMAGKVSTTNVPGFGITAGENSRGAFGNAAGIDADKDNNFYTAYVKYIGKNFEGGFLEKYIRGAAYRNVLGAAVQDSGATINGYTSILYGKAKFGVVSMQAEFAYLWGDAGKWEGNQVPAAFGGPMVDSKFAQMSAFLDVTADLGKFYAGGTFAYVSGDDFSTNDKSEGGNLSGGLDYNPCLIMFNTDLSYWTGTQAGYANTTANGSVLANAYFMQLRAGVRPVDKLDIMMSGSYAVADKTPRATWESRKYGYEVDVTGTYKITNNLSYMLGGGYFFTGDYFKGAAAANEIENNYMLLNKLTLTF